MYNDKTSVKGYIIPMDCLTISTFRNLELQALAQRNYSEIYKHELAHKQAGGALAGSIVIDKNAQGIPVGGHVDIKMPSINPENPKEAIKQADTVIKSALAPADPSSQDYRVASKARAIKNQAQSLLNNKRLDYYA